MKVKRPSKPNSNHLNSKSTTISTVPYPLFGSESPFLPFSPNNQ